MKREAYVKMTDLVRERKALRAAVIWSDRLLTKLAYIIYPVFVIILFIKKDPDAVRALLVPGISFGAVSLFRWAFRAPRPYEVFETTPVIKKNTKGKSFPSRHVFSIFVIGASIMWFSPLWGAALMGAGAVMAAARVLGGVHFPRDVIAGALIGAGCGIAGFWLIP